VVLPRCRRAASPFLPVVFTHILQFPEIAKSAYEDLKQIESGERVRVGVNQFQVDEPVSLRLMKVDPAEEERQIEKIPLKEKGEASLKPIGGSCLTAMGYMLFISSVIVRGRYSVSWEMPDDHKLIVTGPYRYIRHPSYTGYFLMFIGLSMMWLNLMSSLPLLGIVGYVRVADIEEQLLTKRFGTKYEIYRKETGRFIPKAFKGRA
jgi:hypothetical protein